VLALLSGCGGADGPVDQAGDPPPPDAGCGKEVRDCDLGALEPVPARCSRPSFEYAIASEIDDAGFAFEEVACDGRYATLRVDVGSALCPPEATKKKRRECTREKVAFFVARDDAWRIVTYAERGDCATVRAIEPSFPGAVCDP
jgi:hypothetical protein